jgi:hypothetical protein
MLSRGTATAALALSLVLTCVGTARAEQDHATPQEVMQRVQQAAQDIAKSGEPALATFANKNAASVWRTATSSSKIAREGPLSPSPTRSAQSSRASTRRRS